VGSVVVVGGGIAGLAAAHRLKQLGHTASVLEREEVAGGRMRSERVGDFVVDRGAQFIASGYRNLHRVAAEIGLAGEIHPLARAHNAMLRGGVLLPGDYDSPLGFLRSRLLSASAKLRLPRLLFDLWRHREALDPLRPEKAAPLDREDMARYVRRVAGDENLEYLFGPALSSTFDSDPEDLSGAFLLLALRFVLGGFRLECFEGGIGRLTETLAARTRARPQCDVVEVRTEAGGARVRYRQGGSEREALADAAIVAVPGPLAPALCPELRGGEREFLSAVRYVRGIIVFLLLERAPATLPYYGVAFPRSEGLEVYGLAVDHHKPGVCPDGAGLVNVALTATAAARLWDEPDEVIAGHVLGELARTPIGRLSPHTTLVHRWDPMLPQFHAGYLPRLAAFLARSERSPRIAFAGDYLVGPYTECALVSGLRAADEVAAMLRR
jgi:oxygen-dependent protoporphyrinogen oxidase